MAIQALPVMHGAGTHRPAWVALDRLAFERCRLAVNLKGRALTRCRQLGINQCRMGRRSSADHLGSATALWWYAREVCVANGETRTRNAHKASAALLGPGSLRRCSAASPPGAWRCLAT